MNGCLATMKQGHGVLAVVVLTFVPFREYKRMTNRIAPDLELCRGVCLDFDVGWPHPCLKLDVYLYHRLNLCCPAILDRYIEGEIIVPV